MKYTVIGAGHGGQALAGYLAWQGKSVILYNRTESVISNIKNKGWLDLHGCIEARIEGIDYTSNLEYAVKKSDVIMVCIPSNHHKELAILMSAYLARGQNVILNPGRTMGAYEFSNIVEGGKRGIRIAETDTFLLTSRKIEDGVSRIFSFKKRVYLSAVKKEDTLSIVESVKDVFPMIKGATNMVQTSLSNVGVVFHPIPAIFNIGRIECKEKYLHYKEGITPTVCSFIEKLDRERIELSHAIGQDVLSAKEWIKEVYGSKGDTLYEVIQNTDAYNEVVAPTEISTRYIYEDICTGIVPMYFMMKKLNLNCEIMEIVIKIATELFDYDFVGNGRMNVEGFLATLNLD